VALSRASCDSKLASTRHFLIGPYKFMV
jgi:hypothetical protein